MHATIGVFPLPPTVMFPTLTTGSGSRLAEIVPDW
jgi:hypothetical protein